MIDLDYEEGLVNNEIKTFKAPQYLIISLSNGYWEKYEDLMFWGKNRNGYEQDIRKAGLYTKEEAMKLCDSRNVYISINKINIPKEAFGMTSKDITIKIAKTDKICDYVNKFIALQKNKKIMKWG